VARFYLIYFSSKKNILKYFVFIGICVLALVTCKNKRTDKRLFNASLNASKDSSFIAPEVLSDSGWTDLTSVPNLQAWHTYGKKTAGKAWNIDSSSIHLIPGTKNGYQTAGGGDLISNDTFSRFDLKLEWKIGKRANSGIMIYVQEDPSKYKETWNTGPEIQVCDKDSNEDAHSVKHEAGDLYDLISSRIQAAKPALEWNQVEIICNKNRLDIYLNEVHVISTDLWNDSWKKLIAGSKFKEMPGFGTFQSGHIALQDHGEEVWYRKIRVKKIN
jgi:hypothetical protein